MGGGRRPFLRSAAIVAGESPAGPLKDECPVADGNVVQRDLVRTIADRRGYHAGLHQPAASPDLPAPPPAAPAGCAHSSPTPAAPAGQPGWWLRLAKSDVRRGL